MIHKTQQQQILILTGLEHKTTHQIRERNQNIDLEKMGVMETEESCQATNPDELEEEQTQPLHLRHKFSREHQKNFLSMRGWRYASLTQNVQHPAFLYQLQKLTIGK